MTTMAPTVTRPGIAGDALRYRGHPYVYGQWDCSGFVNHVLGEDLGFVLPGGIRHYSGPPPHGPVVEDYAAWGGATTIPGPPAAGDLVVWPGLGPNGHIGICVSATHMISALNPQYGTIVTPIANNGPNNRYIFRRVHGAGGGAPSGGAAGQLASAASSVMLRLILVTGLAGGLLLVLGGLAAAAAAAGPELAVGVLLGRRARSDQQ